MFNYTFTIINYTCYHYVVLTFYAKVYYFIWIKINLLISIGLVYSLGRSEYGRLGLGEDCERVVSKPTTIPSLQDKKCINVSCGNVESFALEDNGNFFNYFVMYYKHRFIFKKSNCQLKF